MGGFRLDDRAEGVAMTTDQLSELTHTLSEVKSDTEAIKAAILGTLDGNVPGILKDLADLRRRMSAVEAGRVGVTDWVRAVAAGGLAGWLSHWLASKGS